MVYYGAQLLALRSRPILNDATHISRARRRLHTNFRWRSPSAYGVTSRGLHVGTVCTATIESIEQLVKSIEPSATSKLSDNNTLLLVLSPGFAKHARNPDLPVTVASQLVGRGALKGQLTSVTAVVDGLFVRGGEAFEGVAYALQESNEAPVTEFEPLRPTAQRPGSITFALSRAVGQQEWQIQLPLSQTIFSLGTPSTLIRREHALDSADSSATASETYLESLSYNIPTSHTTNDLNIGVPLVQLTSYRTVGQSMGNIVRTVSTLDTDKEEPASRNLESAVTAYFDALDASPEPVSVWALVIPKKVLLKGRIDKVARDLVLDDAELQQKWRAWQGPDQNINDIPYRALLQERARLVKVLSGGGGWGKKAGLLSLDPDLEYSTRELRSDYGWQFDFEQTSGDSSVGQQIDQVLGASVEEGDGIVFFIAPTTTAHGYQEVFQATTMPTIAFGVSAASSQVAGQTNTDASTHVRHIRDYFGVVSETGLALKIRQAGKVINKTKLEIPGVGLSLVTGSAS